MNGVVCYIYTSPAGQEHVCDSSRQAKALASRHGGKVQSLRVDGRRYFVAAYEAKS